MPLTVERLLHLEGLSPLIQRLVVASVVLVVVAPLALLGRDFALPPEIVTVATGSSVSDLNQWLPLLVVESLLALVGWTMILLAGMHLGPWRRAALIVLASVALGYSDGHLLMLALWPLLLLLPRWWPLSMGVWVSIITVCVVGSAAIDVGMAAVEGADAIVTKHGDLVVRSIRGSLPVTFPLLVLVGIDAAGLIAAVGLSMSTSAVEIAGVRLLAVAVGVLGLVRVVAVARDPGYYVVLTGIACLPLALVGWVSRRGGLTAAETEPPRTSLLVKLAVTAFLLILSLNAAFNYTYDDAFWVTAIIGFSVACLIFTGAPRTWLRGRLAVAPEQRTFCTLLAAYTFTVAAMVGVERTLSGGTMNVGANALIRHVGLALSIFPVVLVAMLTVAGRLSAERTAVSVAIFVVGQLLFILHGVVIERSPLTDALSLMQLAAVVLLAMLTVWRASRCSTQPRRLTRRFGAGVVLIVTLVATGLLFALTLGWSPTGLLTIPVPAWLVTISVVWIALGWEIVHADGRFTGRDSAAYPRPARVLLYYGSVLLVMQFSLMFKFHPGAVQWIFGQQANVDLNTFESAPFVIGFFWVGVPFLLTIWARQLQVIWTSQSASTTTAVGAERSVAPLLSSNPGAGTEAQNGAAASGDEGKIVVAARWIGRILFLGCLLYFALRGRGGSLR